jgi:virulence-associated protein VagC
MSKVAKLFITGGSQAIRLPKEFRFPGKTVSLRRTKHGVLVTAAEAGADHLRRKLARIAGSCPDFPLREPHIAPDLPRDLKW